MFETLTMWITGLVEAIGPLGIGLVLLVENLFPPIPSEAVLPFAGFLVYRGELSLVAALASSTLGSVTGALVLYEVGHRGGRRFVLRWGHVLRIDEEDLDRVGGWIDRHGPAVIMGARMIPFARRGLHPRGTSGCRGRASWSSPRSGRWRGTRC